MPTGIPILPNPWTGPITLPDQSQPITKDNLYPLLQRLDEPFFPGSTLKRDTLLSFSTGLQLALQNLNQDQRWQLLEFLYQSNPQKDILLWAKNKQTQKILAAQKWTGELSLPANSDFFGIVEANLGVNKGNCCV